MIDASLYNVDNAQSQMRRGLLEFCILLVIAQGKVYSSDILKELKRADLIVVEGTLYPLLSRLKKAELLRYSWKESKNGPPRKYYELTDKGKKSLEQLSATWGNINKSISALKKKTKN